MHASLVHIKLVGGEKEGGTQRINKDTGIGGGEGRVLFFARLPATMDGN